MLALPVFARPRASCAPDYDISFRFSALSVIGVFHRDEQASLSANFSSVDGSCDRKRRLCAHMCEGDEDTITQKHTPQNGISGLSASKCSKETIAFPSGRDFTPLRPMSLIHPFAVTLWSRYWRLTIRMKPGQNKCNVSAYIFNKRWLCFISSL